MAVLLQKITNKLILLLSLSVICVSSYAADAEKTPANYSSQHDHAVALARKDHYNEGLAILKKLLKVHPNDYPVRRDYVVIATWKGDCDDALKNYQHIARHPNQESYLVIPVSQCLHDMRRDDEALALLRKQRKANPDDDDVKQAYQDMLDDIKNDRLPQVTASLGYNNSDRGSREWFWDLRYSQQISNTLPQLRGYAHYYTTHAVDSQFATGDMHRLGVGINYWFNSQWMLDQELFTDLQNTDTGSRSQLHYYINNLTHVSGEYNSNINDISLRAKAKSIKARRIKFDADYHTADYRWELNGSAAKSKFTDSNSRTSLYGSAGYAYLMRERLEQRVIVELSHSTNTLAGTDYYNPVRDTEVDVNHRTSFVYDSRFDRHVDNLNVFIGRYNETGYGAGTTEVNYGTATVYGVSYEQQYDFDRLTSLSWNAGYASRIYDGNRETDTSFLLTVSRKVD